MADSPKQAEAAQALFSAIVDYTGAPDRDWETSECSPIPTG